MLSLEEIFGSENADLVAQIRAQDRAYARDLLDRLTRPLPSQHVTDWALENVRFDEPKFKGPFTTHTRHYLEEPLNLWRRDLSNDITDLICCWATRSAKTRIPMAGMAYRIALDPVRCLWTKPMKHGAGGSRNDAITKFIPMLKASPGLEQAVQRCDKNSLNGNQQRINGSIVDWEGTGSAKQLSGNPDDVVVQDECDGYVLKGNTEAHPSILADERTKDASNPLRYKSCSPTVEAGVIWQWLMRSDLRRRFVPCPRCNPAAEPRGPHASRVSPRRPAEASKQPLPVLSESQTLEILKRHHCADQLTAAMQWQKEN
jgi:phage terminase large subunit GpA-like protein